MQRILVTGAGGFVGSYLIRALQAVGDYDVFATVYKSSSSLETLLTPDHIIEGDLTDGTFANALIQTTKPNIIFHLAALSVVHSSDKQALSVLTANTALQYNLLESVRQFAPHVRLIAICSANEYGLVENYQKPITEDVPLRPLNPYAVSKVTQEMLTLQYHLAYGLDAVILRPFNHTGAGQTLDFVVPALARQFARIVKGLEPPFIEVGNIDNVRDFTDVVDMVSAYILASKKGESGQVYNLGSGVGVKVRDLIAEFERITGVKVEIKVEDSMLRVADVPILVCDSTKFRQLTGWSPKISLNTTLTNVYNYWKEQI